MLLGCATAMSAVEEEASCSLTSPAWESGAAQREQTGWAESDSRNWAH